MPSSLSSPRRLARALLHLLVLLPLLSLSACAGKKAPELRGPDYYFDKGERDFDKHHYLQAVESFQRIVSNFPGHARVAEAQYYLAESYYGMEDFVNAVFEYERLVDTYPSSPWRDDAQYKIGESWFRQSRRAELDQTETYEAIASFRRFIEDNPGSPLITDAQNRIIECRSRLAKKEFLAGRLYQRQGYLKAARITYEQLLRGYPLTPWYWDGLAYLGEVARQQGELAEARGHFREVLAGAEDAKLLEQVRGWLVEMDAEAGAPDGD